MIKKHQKYSDKYFLRSKTILEKEKINPAVKIQCFIRKGPGHIDGIIEAVNFIKKYSNIEKIGGRIFALKDGMKYEPNETVMLIEAPLQTIIDLETIYLGIISAETTKINNDKSCIDPEQIKERMQEIVRLVDGRPVFYFGARHWRYDEDAAISKAAFDGGAAGCSTDEGAKTVGQIGMGTIPHALVIGIGSRSGSQNATLQSAIAFDKHMDKNIKRVALVDTFNKEITDTLAVAKALGDKLHGVRLDTCGENYGELCIKEKGVSVELAVNVRTALNREGFEKVNIVLSSGFAKPEKVKRFVDAEKRLKMRLFDTLGIGQLFESRSATADIVEIDGTRIAKTGRHYRPNKRMVKML